MTAVARGALFEPGSPCSTRPGTQSLVVSATQHVLDYKRRSFAAAATLFYSMSTLSSLAGADRHGTSTAIAVCAAHMACSAAQHRCVALAGCSSGGTSEQIRVYQLDITR
jgi:hypothetical protein